MDEKDVIIKFVEYFTEEIDRDNSVLTEITEADLKEIKRIVLEEDRFSDTVKRLVREYKLQTAKEVFTYILFALEIRREVNKLISKLSV